MHAYYFNKKKNNKDLYYHSMVIEFLQAWFRKNEAGLIFLVLGHNSIYSLDRHLLAKYPDYVHQAGHFDIYFYISILYGLGDINFYLSQA